MHKALYLTAILALLVITATAAIAQSGEQPDDVNNAYHPDAPASVTISGADRYETAAQIALRTYPRGDTEVLYIANGETVVDALGIGVASYNSKMLLVRHNEVPQPTLDALEQIKVCKITFLGGDSVISQQVKDEVIANSKRYC